MENRERKVRERSLGLREVEHKIIDINGITLHVAQAGPQDGPLLILLHGFPEFWCPDRHQHDAFSPNNRDREV